MAVVASIIDLPTGDDWTIRHTIGSAAGPSSPDRVPNGVTLVKAWLIFAKSLLEIEASPLLTKEITTTNGAAGQIEDNNADNGGVGVLRFEVPRSETGQFLPHTQYGYIIRVEYSTGKRITSEKGVIIPQ